MKIEATIYYFEKNAILLPLRTARKKRTRFARCSMQIIMERNLLGVFFFISVRLTRR